MPNKIKPKRSYTTGAVPTTSDLDTNEVAINWTDGKLYTKTASGNIVSATLGGSSGLTWSSVPASATATGTAGSIAYDSSYYYVCVATNTWVRTALATWTVPVITIGTQPSNQTASSGAATFSVSASVTQSATLSYQWQRSTNSGSTFTAISGATSSSLALTGLASGDSDNQYRVVVSATGGATSVTSSAATVTVAGSFTAMAVMLTSGTSYTVPSGATSMKAWAVGGGGGGGANFANGGGWEWSGGAGGTAYKTWSVSGGNSVSFSIGAGADAYGATSVRYYGNDTTVTFSGVTITGGGGSKTTSSFTKYDKGGVFSGGDGGANGGDGGGYWDTQYWGSGGAVGGNAGSEGFFGGGTCHRFIMTDVSGLKAALALAGVNTTESCQTQAAFGSGSAGNKYGLIATPGLGGGGHSMTGGQGLPNVAGGNGAVILYFT